MILDAVKESGGVAMAAPEEDIEKWMRLAISQEGISLCPETAICLGVLEQMIAKKLVAPKERVVVFNTGAAQKYPEAVHEKLPHLDLNQPIDWKRM